ncbi:MAG: 50S ribosomal protein L6, partial [Acidobacteria bacterium]|nr:50S ribosomal protein L6 [Acidobacteriota bacterium]
SRIGKLPINVPQGVTAELKNSTLTFKGPKGESSSPVPSGISASIEDGVITFTRADETGPVRAKHGLARALAQNSLTGVTAGFQRKLEIIGVGYKVNVAGNTVEFHLGYSHPIHFPLPQGVKATVELDKATKAHVLTLEGIDKQLLGQVAANIRSLRKPEPYKGKGVRYFGERIRIKAGKSGK